MCHYGLRAHPKATVRGTRRAGAHAVGSSVAVGGPSQGGIVQGNGEGASLGVPADMAGGNLVLGVGPCQTWGEVHQGVHHQAWGSALGRDPGAEPSLEACCPCRNPQMVGDIEDPVGVACHWGIVVLGEGAFPLGSGGQEGVEDHPASLKGEGA